MIKFFCIYNAKMKNIKILRFILVGFATFIFHAITFYSIHKILLVDIFKSATIAFLLTLIVHYLLNKYYTFQINEGRVKVELVMYLLLQIFNYITTIVILYFILNILIISPYYNTLISTIFNMIINYMVMNRIIFKNKDL